MKLLAPLLLVLVSGVALAQPPTTIEPPPMKAVAVMTDTQQALLWDMGSKSYVVVRVGEMVGSYLIADIQLDRVDVVDPAKPHVRHILTLKPKAIRTAAAPDDGLAVMDPYPDQATAATLNVLNPYSVASVPQASGRTPELRPSRRPPTQVAPTVITADPGPEPAKLMPAAPARPAPIAPPVVVAAPVAPAVKPALPVRETQTVARSDLDAALADFDTVVREIRIEQVAGGGVRVLDVARGSFFHRLGIRKGDVIRAVAGERLSSVESAARVYARIQVVDEFDIELERGPQRVFYTCRVK